MGGTARGLCEEHGITPAAQSRDDHRGAKVGGQRFDRHA